jgi:hypothetical protein
VLTSVTVQKAILSTADSATALKFFDQGTQAFEAEMGLTINEPGTYAVKAATEMAVVELIKEGARKGIWDYKQETPAVVLAPIVEKKAPVISSEIKKDEEKKDVVVQPQAVPEVVIETLPPAPEAIKVEEKKVEVKKVEVPKAEPRALFGNRRLKEDSYLYPEAIVSSTKKWQFKKGTEVKVVQPGSEGWLKVIDSESRGGWIRIEQLEEIK